MLLSCSSAGPRPSGLTQSPTTLFTCTRELSACRYGHYCALIYSWLAERLAEIGIQSFGIEHHGHGKSGGLRGYVPDFSAVVDDVLAYSATIRSTELPAGVPLFA